MDANYNYKHKHNYNLNHNNNHKLHFLHGGARFSACFVENSVENLWKTPMRRRGADEKRFVLQKKQKQTPKWGAVRSMPD